MTDPTPPPDEDRPERPRRSLRLSVPQATAAVVVILVMLFAAYQLGASTSDSSPRRVRHRSPAATASIVIPTHSPVPPRPRSVEPFTGLGTWVDVYDRELWNDPTAAAASMKAQGIRTLYLQTSNYAKPYDLFEPAAMSALVEAAHAQGIKVVAWYLPGLANLTRDVSRCKAAIDFKTTNGQTFDGFGLDIEAQILDPPSARSRALLELSQRIRALAPKLPLGAITPSPVALQTPPNGWPSFPWAGLNQYYDAFVPMDYFAATAHGRAQVQDYVVLSVEIIRGATGDPSVPIAPIGGIAQAVTAQEAQGFVDAIQQTGSIGGSLYDFRTTTDPAVWDQLKRIG